MALGSSWRPIRLLPADATDAKPYKLVAAESGDNQVTTSARIKVNGYQPVDGRS